MPGDFKLLYLIESRVSSEKGLIMKRKQFTIKLIVLLFCSFITIAKADLWTAKTSYPTMSAWNIFFAMEGKGYLGAGYEFHQDFWMYDPGTNIWTQKADYGGGPMWGGCSFSIGSSGYAGMGYDTNYTLRRDFWEYDPLSNVWSQKANFGGSGRVMPVFFAANGMGYAGMGYDSINIDHNDLWQYKPFTDTWIQKTSLPAQVREGPNSFVIGNIAYIVGGASTTMLDELWEYNTISDTWSQMANFPFSTRCCGVALSLCQKGYFGTGSHGISNTYYNDLWQYDPFSGAWTQKTSIPGAGRMASASFTIDDKAYVGAGVNHLAIYNTFYEYTPDSSCLTGINDEHDFILNMEIFPNPAKGFTFVKFNNGKMFTDVVLKITDLKGKVWQQVHYTDAISEIKIGTDNLAPGIYLLQLRYGDLNCIEKIVVQ